MNLDVKSALGRTTALAVTNGRGNVLLPEGFEITEPIIAALVKQGIQTIEVLDQGNNESLKLINEKRLTHIENLFNDFTTPNMTELKECLIKQILS